MKRASKAGFTLVELAIVMVIIGLLIGGILKGQELVESARVKAFISQVKAYQAAPLLFQDKYNGLPGDLRTATSSIANCTAATFCSNGNGDRVLGTALMDWSNDATNQLGTSMPALETTMFWKHLALADMISGVNAAADPTAPSWGQTHPFAKIRGGFLAISASETVEYRANGLYVAWKGVITPDNQPWTSGTAPAEPQLARNIDQAMDDGNAATGNVRSDHGLNQCANQATGVYSQALSNGTCIMIFKVY